MSDRWLELFDAARAENGNGNITKAHGMIAEAVIAAEDVLDDSRSYSSAQASFALWYDFFGDHASAIAHQKRHVELEKTLGIAQRELGNLMLSLADMQQHASLLAEACVTIEEAISIISEDYIPERLNALEQLAGVVEQLGDHPAAVAAREKARHLKDDA